MGFLAFLALPLAIAPSVFSGVDKFASIGIWAIVGIFALEYGSNLLLTSEKKKYVLNPWRLLDLAIIVAPLFTLLPGVGTGLSSSPVVRLVRLLRAAVFMLRAGGVIVFEQIPPQVIQTSGVPLVSVLPFGGQQPRQTSWFEFQRWETDRENQWYHVSNLTLEKFDEVARAAGIPLPLIESCCSDANFPRVEGYRNATVLSAWLPSSRITDSRLQLDRTSMLIVVGKSWMITVSRPHCDLQNLIMNEFDKQTLPEAPFELRIVMAFLQIVLKRNEELAGHLERALRALEDLPVQNSRPEFFSRTFEMRKELSAAKSDLWRFKGLLSTLAEGRVHIKGSGEASSALFHLLADQADYLYETVDNLREGVLSVIELHLNVVSFGINRFMRILAAVSALGLIPTIVGGLLGMNLVGNPWPVTLTQVTFSVTTIMLACLYVLVVKRWLR
jgi:Mg2+ and Co2+ transporter CorA